MTAWQPMETAPKDRRILTRRPGRTVGISKWNTQPHHSNPKPYWEDERMFFGVRSDRGMEPTGWMPLPEDNPCE